MIFLHCISYIIWTSENFPKGGKDLANLLERCMTTFKDQERYKNDERYAKVWLRYVSIYLSLCCLFYTEKVQWCNIKIGRILYFLILRIG